MRGVAVALVALMLFGLAVPTRAAHGETRGTWTLQAPQPTQWDLFGVDMVSATEGWAVGEEGEILHTTDGGNTWSHQASGTEEPLHGVRFLDTSRGWAVGNVTRYTTDGGLTWRAGRGTLGTLNDVDFVDPMFGWAVGIGGTLYGSTDGGRNWTWLNTTGTDESLLSVDFVTRQLGWIVGSGGTIIRTTDGGNSWQGQQSGTTQFLSGVSFVDSNEGWAGGGDVVLHTTNRGASWTRQDLPGGAWLYGLSFGDPLHGWGAGDGHVVGTSDGGQTWTMQAVVRDLMEEVDAVSPSHAVAVGWSPAILTTTDGGTTWIDQVNGPISIGYAVDTTDMDHAWVAEAFGQIARTEDGGSSWERVSIGNPYGHLWGVDFATDEVGWVVGDGDQSNNYGIVYRSVDGGRTWSLQLETPGLDIIYDVAAITPRRAVVVSALGFIRYTTDGGATWFEADRPSGSLLNSVEFNGRVGWVSGNQATVEKSMDGGRTWVDRSPSPGYDAALMDVSFADQNNGWVVGFYGDVFHTTNGGISWQRQTVQGAGDMTFLDVEAISPTTAWISGGPTEAFVARTTNGGVTWTQEPLPSPDQAYSVSGLSFVDAENGYAAGHVGVWRRTA